MWLSLLLAGLQGAAPAKPVELYRQVVGRALERVQAELLSAADFDVDHSTWDDPWVVATEHYEVRTTKSYAQARTIADSSEFLRGEFVKLLGEGSADSDRRPIWVLPSIGEYNRFGEQNGAEHSSMLGSFYADRHAERPIVSYENGNATQVGMWVTHSAVHEFLAQQFGPQRLLWVEEGLASYFALFWSWSYGAQELERLEQSPSFIPLSRLLSEEPLQSYLQRPHERLIELGMLFHFLLNSCEATKNGAAGDPATGPFQEFLRAAVRGENVSQTEFWLTFVEGSALLEAEFKDHPFPP